MAEIALCRVDTRLLHGQIVTRWKQQLNLTKCIIVDNELPKNDLLSQIYVSAAPADMKVKIYDEAKAIRIWNKNQFAEGRVLLLLNNIEGCLTLAEGGVDIKAVQLGGLPGAPGRVMVAKSVQVNKEELEVLRKLRDRGIEVYAQMTPENERVGFDAIERKATQS